MVCGLIKECCIQRSSGVLMKRANWIVIYQIKCCFAKLEGEAQNFVRKFLLAQVTMRRILK
jgi:hypothetical protein